MSLSSCNPIKGIFAVIIFFSHMRGYIVFQDNVFDMSFDSILNYIGQLMVAIYLFYSGYGIFESFKVKSDYFYSFPKRRIIKILLHFDIAVFFFLLLSFIVGDEYSTYDYIMCWIAWESLGNSNWFIFVILMLYVISYISYHIYKKMCVIIGFSYIKKGLVYIQTVTFLSIVLWIVLYLSHRGGYWYDTIMVFPIGMAYSFYKKEIDSLLSRSVMSIAIIISLMVIFIMWYHYTGIDIFGVCSCLFCILLVVLSSKIRIGNKILQWLGTYSFSIYIIQRLPMIVLKYMGINNEYIFAVLSIVFVLIAAYVYENILRKVDQRILT